MIFVRILFVCTGNTCRSPMAAAIMLELDPDAQTRSRGLAVFSAQPASLEARAVMEERGLDISAHMSAPVTPEDIEWADAVYGLTEAHAQALASRFPQHVQKIRALPGGGVGDPFGGSADVYRVCARAIEEALKEL